VLGALTQTLPSLGLEFNLRKTTVCGPGLVPESSALTAATRLHLEEGTKMLWVPIHSPLYHAPVWTHLGTLATASASPEPTLFHAAQVATGGALATSRLRGQAVPLCGGPLDVFGDHAVSCKKSGFGYWHLGTQTFFCQVFTQS